ncbi:MAG: hypothetical protein QM802_17405 [Agriterribacter sp.]
MKHLLTTSLFFISTFCFSQVTTDFQNTGADSGKHEFKLQAKKDTADYTNAYRILTSQVNTNPTNAELRYFLAYAIDRMNAGDGSGMLQLKKEMTIEASEQLEEVNRLEPIYKGELFLLDPYSKLTSIWGSLAEAYLNRKLTDSAVWAFTEGKKRGGFIEPVLAFNRQLLNSCDSNAILITYGDNITIPIWYLQTIESYRTDIVVVDANLTNASWYSKYLKSEKKLAISFSEEAIDTIDYMPWTSQTVSIVHPADANQTFSWELRPTYMEKYILKGDRMVLDILQQNLYTRPIYFNINSDSTYNLFLTPFLTDEGLVSRINPGLKVSEDSVFVSKNIYSYTLEKINETDIEKSRDAVILLNNYRLTFFYNIYRLASEKKHAKAKELINLVTTQFPKEKLPFISQEFQKYFTDIYEQVQKN